MLTVNASFHNFFSCLFVPFVVKKISVAAKPELSFAKTKKQDKFSCCPICYFFLLLADPQGAAKRLASLPYSLVP